MQERTHYNDMFCLDKAVLSEMPGRFKDDHCSRFNKKKLNGLFKGHENVRCATDGIINTANETKCSHSIGCADSIGHKTFFATRHRGRSQALMEQCIFGLTNILIREIAL
ncbi:hypothetical protein L798_04049 [Zootermopsis nevadensis]|uniref:Uncharacterized protein n=1 Tax=Zootermopsis nevadensis TaxID=136037 RepID=A0A067QF15_ZOONE|nr:hypothetical protein L798_04049 [Zootermopsis nevadensis]